MRRIAFISVTLFIITALTLGVCAQSLELAQLERCIPEQALDNLPEHIFDNNEINAASAFSFSYFAGQVKKAFSGALGDNLVSLATIFGLVIISSLFHLLAQSAKGGLEPTFSSVSALCVCVYVFTTVSALFKTVSVYLTTLASFATAVTPMISIAYAAGGNVSTAALSTTGLLVCITVVENISAYVLYPLLSVSAAITAACSLAPKLRLGSLSSFLRGFLMLLISLTVAAISAIMTFQQTLSTAADTLGARAVRFAASSFIPIVGSAVSEAVRTVSGSISYIRSSIGGIGIVVIALITLPVFASLMLARINLSVSASLSDMLSCEREAKVLKEAGSLVNFLIAIVSLMAVMFIYSLTLLVRCASSYG